MFVNDSDKNFTVTILFRGGNALAMGKADWCGEAAYRLAASFPISDSNMCRRVLHPDRSRRTQTAATLYMEISVFGAKKN